MQISKARKIHFTKKTLDGLTSPDKKELYFHDDEVKGLCVRVSKVGAKTFYLYMWNSDKGYSQRHILGHYPEMTIDQARRLALRRMSLETQKDLVKQGETDHSITFSQLFELYRQYAELEQRSFKRHTLPHYSNHFKRWYDRQLGSIAKSEVQDWVTIIGRESGKRTANHCHAIMRAIINWGIQSDILKLANPCVGVRRFTLPNRVRFLQPGDEFNRFMQALDDYKDQDAADLFRVALWTGGRIKNVREMLWQDVNLTTRLWTIPALKYKNKEHHTVNLIEPAMAILKRRSQAKGRSKVYVFGTSRNTLVKLSWAWKRIMKDAEIINFTPHDLRHTLASYMAMSGASLQTIAKALGHKSIRSTEIYAHLLNQPVRAAVSYAVQCMKDPSLILGEPENED